MIARADIPLWLRPRAFLNRSGNSQPNADCSLQLGSQRSLCDKLEQFFNPALKRMFDDSQVWLQQKDAYFESFHDFFASQGPSAELPAWIAVIRNRTGHFYRPKYGIPIASFGAPIEDRDRQVWQGRASTFDQTGTVFGLFQGVPLPRDSIQIVGEPRTRTIVDPQGIPLWSKGFVKFATLPDWYGPESGHTIPALTNSLQHGSLKTCSIVLVKMHLYELRQVTVAEVYQRIITCWATSGHTAAQADDWERPLEMYLRIYAEEHQMLSEIIDGQ